MAETLQPPTVRRLRLALWMLFAVAFVFLYYQHTAEWGADFQLLAQSSTLLAYAVYLGLGALRGFTLIPVTNLVVLAIPIFPPVPLFALTLVGILISSACIYAFAGSLRLAEHFEHQHRDKAAKVRAALHRSPTAIVTAWSFLPIVPTDLICYVCGIMRISLPRFMLGVLVGEGAICAIYIFAGNEVVDFAQSLLGG